MIHRERALSGNMVQFCRFLRTKGFVAGIGEARLSLHALSSIAYSDPAVFCHALKIIFCKSKAQFESFDSLFNAYWQELRMAVNAKTKDRPLVKKSGLQPGSLKTLQNWLHGNRNNDETASSTYSSLESLSRKDFSRIREDERDELMRSLRALAKRLAVKVNRRYRPTRRELVPDLRRTLRKNLRRGGELLELGFKKPKNNRTRLVLVCDMSKSMEIYSSFAIQFMFAFQHVFDRLETFAFGTSLHRITQILRDHDFASVLEKLGAENDWFGGTRIGACLDIFIHENAKKLLDRGTIVIIVSDGWDRGDIDLLRQSMNIIHRRVKKIIWLNPLAGSDQYRPDVAGMQAALPFVDVFAPVHNLESLRRLGNWL